MAATAGNNMPSLIFFIMVSGLLCSFAATFDTAKQKESEAVDLGVKHVRQDVAAGVPEMPKNLQVIPQSSSAIMLVWSLPSSHDVDHYRVYVYNEDKEDISYINYYIWEDLEPCHTYTFGVEAVSAEGDMSEAAVSKGNTEAEIPSEPKDFHVTNYTFDSDTLMWENPGTPCALIMWAVSVTKATRSLSQVARIPIATAVMSNLTPNVTYTFSASVITYAGRGPKATLNQTTAPHVGGPPEDLSAESINSSAIMVTWSAPITLPSHYVVEVSDCKKIKVTVSGLKYMITDLQPCQFCFIEVMSVYDDGAEFRGSIFSSTTCSE